MPPKGLPPKGLPPKGLPPKGLHRDARRIGPVQVRPCGFSRPCCRPRPDAPKGWHSSSGTPVSASGPVRRRFRPESHSLRLAVPRLHSLLPLPTFDPPRRSVAFLLSSGPSGCGLPTARLSLHLRLAGDIPKNAPDVFSDTAAGIAAGSCGLVFPCCSSGFPPVLQVRRSEEHTSELQSH